MRTFITSTFCVVLIFIIWLCFHIYSASEIKYYESTIDTIINEYIANDHWDSASESFYEMHSRWKIFKKRAAFFLDSSALNHIDCTFSKTIHYITARDKSNSSGELAYLKGIMISLHKTETPSAENIF